MTKYTSKALGRRIMIVGNEGMGGREHVTTDTFLRSEEVEAVYVAPGNDGMFHQKQVDPRLHRLKDYKASTIEDIEKLAREAKALDVVAFIGPENPLSLGIVDIFTREDIPVVGPSKEAARLEGSKAYAKDIMHELAIPIPKYRHFADPWEAGRYIDKLKYAVVVKADGLAAGKGSIVTSTHTEAHKAVHRIMVERAFGEAGNRVVIEQWLDGDEFSFFLITDGKTILPLGLARDYSLFMIITKVLIQVVWARTHRMGNGRPS